jgi:hypothetical protein
MVVIYVGCSVFDNFVKVVEREERGRNGSVVIVSLRNFWSV